MTDDILAGLKGDFGDNYDEQVDETPYDGAPYDPEDEEEGDAEDEDGDYSSMYDASMPGCLFEG